MTLIKHELRQGRISFLIWTASVGFLLAVCVFLFPEMEGQMEDVGDVFSSMGAFSGAFGMDRLNFGTLLGFYAIECGNVLGLGGAFFAALCGAGILSKEEKDRTAEFLLTHPVSRARIVTEKLVSVYAQIIAPPPAPIKPQINPTSEPQITDCTIRFLPSTWFMDSLVVITGFTINLMPKSSVIKTEKFPIVVLGTLLATQLPNSVTNRTETIITTPFLISRFLFLP